MNTENVPNSGELGDKAEGERDSSRARHSVANWQDPAVRERRQTAMRASSKNPETVERRSTSQRERWRLARERLVTCFVCGRGPEHDENGAER